LRSTFGGTASRFLQRFSFASFSRIGRNLLLSENLLHAETHTGAIAAALTWVFLLRRLGQVVAVLFTQSAAYLLILPEIALAAACRPVLMVANAVDQDCSVVIHGDPPSLDVCSFRMIPETTNAADGFISLKSSSAAICKRIWISKKCGGDSS